MQVLRRGVSACFVALSKRLVPLVCLLRGRARAWTGTGGRAWDDYIGAPWMLDQSPARDASYNDVRMTDVQVQPLQKLLTEIGKDSRAN